MPADQTPREREALLAASAQPPRRRRRWWRLLALLAVVLVAGLGLLVALIPTIAGSLAPGVIASAASEQIQGSVKVARVGLSWTGPQTIGPVEVRDPQGQLVATVDLKATTNLLSVVFGSMDLGSVDLSGNVTLVRRADGSTNLEQALAPRTPAAPRPPAGAPSAQPARLPKGLAARLGISGLDIAYRELDAAGSVAREASITGLRGFAEIKPGPAGSGFSASLDGTVGPAAAAAGSAAGAIALSASVPTLAGPDGTINLAALTADLKANATGLPVPLLDALANQHGRLSGALGDTLAFTIIAAGSSTAGNASVQLTSPNARADLGLKLADGRLSAERPGVIELKSTAFAAAEPAVRDALAKAGAVVDTWPGVRVAIDTLTLPVPGTGPGAGSNASASLADTDMRAAAITLAAEVSALSGTLNPLPGIDPPGTPARPFAVSPARLTVALPPGGQSLRITAATDATIAGTPAGTLDLAATLERLLDDAGRLTLLRGANPGSMLVTLELTGLATQLAQPIVSSMNLPIELRDDVGETLDVQLSARSESPAANAPATSAPATSAPATSGPPGAAPIDADLKITSRQITASFPLRLDGGLLTTRGPGEATIAATVPALRRLLAPTTISPAAAADAGAAPAAPPVTLEGRGAVTLRVEQFAMLLTPPPYVPSASGTPASGPLDGLTASLSAQIDDLSFALPAADPRATPSPVGVGSLSAAVTLAPGQPAGVTLRGQMTHGGQPFTLEGDLRLLNLPEALADATPAGKLPGVGRPRIQGQITLTDAPASLVDAAGLPRPSVDNPGAPDLRALLQGVVGDFVTAQVRFNPPAPSTPAAAPVPGFEPDASRQVIALDVRGRTPNAAASGATMNLAIDVSPAQVRLLELAAAAVVRPETARAVLALAKMDQAQLGFMSMDAPATVRLSARPVAIPLAAASAGAVPTPDFARAGELSLGLLVDEPLVFSNVPVGREGLNGGVRDLRAGATIPLSILAANAQANSSGPARLKAAAQGTLVLDANRAVGTFKLDADAAPDASSLTAKVDLADVDTLALDGVLKQAGLASGALGPRAAVTLSAAKPTPAAPLETRLKLVSERLQADEMKVTLREDRLEVAGPARVTWAIDPAWATTHLLAPRPVPGQPAPAPTADLVLIEPVTLVIDLRRAVIATPAADDAGNPTRGPLAPGVFALDAALSAARVVLESRPRPAGAAPPGAAPPGAAPPGAARAFTLSGVEARASSTAENAVKLDAAIASLASGPGAAAPPVTLNVLLRNLADARGVIDTRAAMIDLDARAQAFPTELLDQLANQKGQLVQLLGTQLNLTAQARNASTSGAGGAAGSVAVEFLSSRPPAAARVAQVSLRGPIAAGALDLRAANAAPGQRPFDAQLAEFKLDVVNADLLRLFPILASVEKRPADGPASVSTGNLLVPLDGNMANLNGVVDVDLGKINYTLQREFGEFLDTALLTGAQEQRPVTPFAVTIVSGVARYDRFTIPIRQFDLRTEGEVNLVNNTINTVTWIPTLAAGKGLVDKFSSGAGGLLNRLTPDLITEGTMLPIRAKGPLSKPSIGPDFELFAKNLGGQVTKPLEDAVKDPAKAIEGVLDIFGPKKK